MESAPRQKILIVITKSNFGGAQRYVYDLSRSLKAGYDVVVACGGEGLMKKRIEEAGVRTVSIPYLTRDVSFFKDIAVFFWMIKLISAEKPAIVHANSSKIGGLTAGAVKVVRWLSVFSKHKKRTRSVFTAHAWAFNEDRGQLSKFTITFFHWLTIILSDHTIAVSDAVRRQIIHTPFIAHKISVVHLGLEAFEPLTRNEARKKLGIGQDEFAIGSIAELHPIKGLKYAIDAIKDVSFDCSYTIIGEGEIRGQLETQIRSNPVLTKRVRLIGFVLDAARYISAFDIFIVPSLSEAFGYVLLEAGHSKVPVIATSVGGIPEIIRDMESGILIHSKNGKEIVRSLEFLYNNPATRSALVTALSEEMRTEFALTTMIERTEEIYKKA